MEEADRVSPSDKHYFFGFHDLLISNKKEDKILALKVEGISHPPLPGDKAITGYITAGLKDFVPVRETLAWNFPQGARQQWLGDSELYVHNDRIGDHWGSNIVDTTINKVIQSNLFPIHCFDPKTNNGFYMNYSRIQRVGGYGYIGLTDKTANADIPSDCGIFIGNIKDNSHDLLISLSEIAACGESKPVSTGFPHYITHLSLNPSMTRLAFLHRYRLADGGETTRLMTINCNGSNMRCLTKGFLSHFTWVNDKQILIWGQKNASVFKLRESKYYNNPILISGVRFIKKKAGGILSSSSNAIVNKSFLLVTDADIPQIFSISRELMSEDGHPMINPIYKEWLVSDTYPDKFGYRTLMLINIKRHKRIDLGKFMMIDTKPDLQLCPVSKAQSGLDESIKKLFPPEQYCFTRSGLHCDLHPRWSHDGNTIYFDSIHEGTRQIYSYKVDKYLNINSR